MKTSANGQRPQEGGVLMGGSTFLALLPLCFLDYAVVQEIYFKGYKKYFLVKMHIFLSPGGI